MSFASLYGHVGRIRAAKLGEGLLACWIMCMFSSLAVAQDTQEAPQDGAIGQNKPFVSREQVSENMDRAVAFLISEQNEDGSWGSKGPQSVFEGGFSISTHASWQLAANALACSSLAGVKFPSEAEQAALEKSVRFLCTVPLPKRDSDWDIDIVWSAVYGFSTCVELLQLKAFQGKESQTLLDSSGKELLAVLMKH